MGVQQIGTACAERCGFKVLAARGLVPGIGGSVSLSVLSPELAPRYYGRVAPGFAVFFSLQAARHRM